MRNVLAIAGKELRSYFVSPVAYVVLAIFLGIGGYWFYRLLTAFMRALQIYTALRNPQFLARANLNEMVLSWLLHNLSVWLVIITPALTMRTFAEEKRVGTYELLLTSPVRVTEIVVGKFLAGFVMAFLMVGLSGIFGLLLVIYGRPMPEIGMMLSGYLGLLLMALAFVSVGMLTSSLTDNQVIAFISCAGLLLLLYTIGWAAEGSHTLGAILRYLSITNHFETLLKGVIDTSDLVYFASLILVSLFITQRSVESVRWR